MGLGWSIALVLALSFVVGLTLDSRFRGASGGLLLVTFPLAVYLIGWLFMPAMGAGLIFGFLVERLLKRFLRSRA